MISILLLSIIGAMLAAVIGTFWYSPKTPMGKIHMQYLGFDKLSHEEQKRKIDEAKPTMPKIYGAQLALSFLTSFAVVFIVTMSMRNGMPLVASLGFVTMNWLCFMVPIIGSSLLWSNCDKKIVWKKFFSDIGANFVTIIFIGIFASFFV